MSRLFTISTLVVVVLAPACSKKESGAPSAGKPADDKPAAGDDKPAPTKLPHLGRQIDVPGEVTVSDAIGGDGDMVQASAVGALQIEAWKTPQSLDEAKDDAKAFTPKHLQADKLADGYVLTYDNVGSMGANFFVVVRREIGGKVYKCGTTVDTAEASKAAVEACKTLR
jgi:hypothetical protein